MASVGRSSLLADEIELCGKLRNDIGHVLRYKAQRAAKNQTEADEHQAAADLVEKEVSQLEASLGSAEHSFKDASACLDKLELSSAHMKATNSFLSNELKESIQHIDSSNEAFEELRKRHLSFCKMQEDAQRKMASIESLLRSILHEEQQLRSSKVRVEEMQGAISSADGKKASLLPLLEICRTEQEDAKTAFDKSRESNAQLLSAIEHLREAEEELQLKLKGLQSEGQELHAQRSSIEKDIAEGKADINRTLETVTGLQEKSLQEQAKRVEVLQKQTQEKQRLERKHEKLLQETAEATQEMHGIMARMSDLRRLDAELLKNKTTIMNQLKAEEHSLSQLQAEQHIIADMQAAEQKAKALAEEKKRGEARLADLIVMEKTSLVEQREMHALLEQESGLYEERLRTLDAGEEALEEAIRKDKELEGLIRGLDTLCTERREITQLLFCSRKEVDIQVAKADKLEAWLNQLLLDNNGLSKECRILKDEKEQENTLLHSLKKEVSALSVQLEELNHEKLTVHSVKIKFSFIPENASEESFGSQKIGGIEEQSNCTHPPGGKENTEAELGLLREELRKKHEEALNQIRSQCRREYTFMLEQTLKSEEQRLLEEKTRKETELGQQIELLKNEMEANGRKLLSLQPAELHRQTGLII